MRVIEIPRQRPVKYLLSLHPGCHVPTVLVDIDAYVNLPAPC
jgi:hypothetical protein